MYSSAKLFRRHFKRVIGTHLQLSNTVRIDIKSNDSPIFTKLYRQG